MCRARRVEPRTASRTTYANLDCAFVENALVFAVLKIGVPPLIKIFCVRELATWLALRSSILADSSDAISSLALGDDLAHMASTDRDPCLEQARPASWP